MKDIYIIMNGQNILNYYGSKLDLKLDSSELYDYQLTTNEVDYDTNLLQTGSITYTGLTIDSSCLDVNLNDQKPWVVPVNTQYTGDTCDFKVRRRTERGWTLDFIFNRENIAWSGGTVFYYLGTDGDTINTNYLDNNLTFGFTSSGTIFWSAFHYSGYCTTTGYTETNYVGNGQTPVLCVTGNTSDFNLTIVFNRYKEFDNCDLDNMGGFNDLIQGPHAVPFSVDPTTGNTAVTSTQIATGYTITTDIHDWITGATITTQYIEELNKKWADERDRRLGDLNFYLNGNLIYTEKNWEEIIPSYRDNQNMVQYWGGGYSYSHFGPTQYTCGFNIKSAKYYEEPLDFVHVKHNFNTRLNDYDFEICGPSCVDEVVKYEAPTPTPTPTPHPTATPTATPTLVPTATPTPTPHPSSTPTPQPTSTPQPTYTPTPTPVPTSTPTLTPTPSTMYYYNVNIWTGGCSTYVSAKAKSSIPFTIGKFYDNTLYTLVYEIVSNDATSGGTNNITSVLVNVPRNMCSISGPTNTPTPSPTPTNTPTPSPTPIPTFTTGPFNYPFDYMLVEYYFTDGQDTDTVTYISSPSIMLSNSGDTVNPVTEVSGGAYYNYVGTCGASSSGPIFPDEDGHTPYLTYGGDNHGLGAEAVLFDLNEFKVQNPSVNNFEFTYTATYYTDLGQNPMIIRATLWQGGTPILDDGNYTFVNPTATGTFYVQSTGTTCYANIQQCAPFQQIAKLNYNITSHDGFFDYPPNTTLILNNFTTGEGNGGSSISITGITFDNVSQTLDFNIFPLDTPVGASGNCGGKSTHPAVSGTGHVRVLFDNSSGNMFDVVVKKNGSNINKRVSYNSNVLDLYGVSFSTTDVITVSIYDANTAP